MALSAGRGVAASAAAAAKAAAAAAATAASTAAMVAGCEAAARHVCGTDPAPALRALKDAANTVQVWWPKFMFDLGFTSG